MREARPRGKGFTLQSRGDEVTSSPRFWLWHPPDFMGTADRNGKMAVVNLKVV